MRNEQIYSEQNNAFKDDIILNEEQLWKIINSDSSDVSTYVKSLNTAVNKGIAHYWLDEGIDKYNIRIPVYENYLLYFASWVYLPFKKFEFTNYKKAIERGVGLCSQHAIIISEILKEKGIESKIIGLSGHVVASALIDKTKQQWWILDADYGVIVPYNINEIEDNPSIISPYYSQAGYNQELIDKLINFYGKEGNKIKKGVKENYTRYYIERLFYLMKWLLPLLLVIPYVLESQRGKTK